MSTTRQNKNKSVSNNNADINLSNKKESEKSISQIYFPFSNMYMFAYVMGNEEICKQVLELILDIEIDHLEIVEAEKSINPRFASRGIRADVYVKTPRKVIDIEMQIGRYKELPQRFRYYQSCLDTLSLSRGDEFNALPESFIIFICTGDPFCKGLVRYELAPCFLQSQDTPETPLDCGMHWIALSAKNAQKESNEELRKLLKYVSSGNAEENDSTLVSNIDSLVFEANTERQVKERIMSIMTEEQKRIIDLRCSYTAGVKDGTEKGIALGEARGRAEGLADTISTLKQLGVDPQIIEQVKKSFT